MEIFTLPTLFGTDKKGKEREWKIWAEGDTVYKTYGMVGKKIIEGKPRTYKGVNLGKKNETSPHEQAKRTAERDWIKQLDKDYAPKDKKGLKLMKKVKKAKEEQGMTNVGIDAIVRGRSDGVKSCVEKKSGGSKTSSKKTQSGTNMRPMLCGTWEDTPKTLKYFDFDDGVYIQPKLDGTRALCYLDDGDQVVLISRTGKQFVFLSSLRKELRTFLSGHEGVILDLELYADKIFGCCTYKGKSAIYTKGDKELPMDSRFNVITGACRPTLKRPHPLEDQICAYIFDIADSTGKMDQEERFRILDEIFEGSKASKARIVKVTTDLITDKKKIEKFHDKYAQVGFEGVILRSKKLTYESNRRSLKIRKYKKFIDEECKIVGVRCDPGVGRENFTWVCVRKFEGVRIKFYPKPMGTEEQKLEWFDNSDSFKGKMLTVRYQMLSDKGVPRFPRGVGVRDYE